MENIKKIFLILLFTIISLCVYETQNFAAITQNDMNYVRNVTADFSYLDSTPQPFENNGKHIMAYKYYAAEKTTNWTYSVAGYVLHNKSTGNTREKFGVYTSDMKIKIIMEGEQGSDVYTLAIGSGWYVTFADVTEFVENNVEFGADFYLSKLLYANYYGTIYGPYQKFSDFLANKGKEPFAYGTSDIDQKARDGYYNKKLHINRNITVTMHYIDENKNELIAPRVYTGVNSVRNYTYENNIWSQAGLPYSFIQAYYNKEGISGDFGYPYTSSTLTLPEDGKAYNLHIYGIYRKQATFNVHYIQEGGSFNNTNNRLINSIIKDGLTVPTTTNFDIWSGIDPRDNLIDGKAYTISNIRLCDSTGSTLVNMKDILRAEGKEVNWFNLIERTKTALTDNFNQISNVWSNGTNFVLNINDYTVINFVIEYKMVKNSISVTVQYLYGTPEHAEGSTYCLINAGQREGQLKTADVYTYEEGDNVTGIKLPKTISHGTHTHTLVNSYFENSDNGDLYHVGSAYDTRNPGVLNHNLSIIAEYSPCATVNEGIPVYVYYIKEGTSRSSLNSSNSTNFLLGRYKPGEAAKANLPSTCTIGGQSLELKKSYIVNDYITGPATWVSSKKSSENTNGITSFVTTRNVGIGTEKIIYIFAEYGEAEGIETGGKTEYTEFTMEDTDNNARGLIASEGVQHYNVYRGIPSGKDIYAQVKANDYLYTLSGYKVTGDRDYEVTVNVDFTFNWYCYGCYCDGHSVGCSSSCSEDCSGGHIEYRGDDCACDGHSDTGEYTYVYTINRDFEFYTIGSYEVFRINTAFLRNPLLTKNYFGYELWNGEEVNIDSKVYSDFEDHVDFHYNDTFKKTIEVSDTKTLSTVAKGTTPEKPYTSYSYWSNADNTIENIEVRSDKLKVDGETIVPGDTWDTDGDATDPVYSKQVSTDKEFITKNINIPVMQENEHYETTENRIRYVSQEAFGQDPSNDIVTDIDGYYEDDPINNWIDIDSNPTRDDKVNDVAVHTPVYINMEISPDYVDNKETKKSVQAMSSIDSITYDQTTVVLDKSFVIHFDVGGSHRNIKKYNNENDDYEGEWTEDWIKEIPEIKFPFDVYVNTSATDTILCKANTWYPVTMFYCGYTKIGDETGDIKVTVPVWTQEGTYTNGIVMRVIAYNDQAPANKTSIGAYEEGNWNGSYPNDDSSVEGTVKYDWDTKYSRTCDLLTVQVTGRVYDFKFTYTDDPNYKNEFLNGSFADRMINRLPYAQKGDNTTNSYATALRLGSKLRFNLKTKGKESSTVKIVPSFYWVSKNGGALQKVDAYYTDSNGKKVKIVPEIGPVTVNNIPEPGTGLVENISVLNITETPSAYNRTILNNEIINTKQIGRVSSTYNYSNTTNIGKTGKVLLSSTERLALNMLQRYDIATQKFVANDEYAKNYGRNQTVTSVTNDAGGINNILASNSHWYGEFTLPENTWFVAEGGSVNNAIDKQGYVIVYFNIDTLDSGRREYLSYQFPQNNTQWQKEDWVSNKLITLPNGKTTRDLVYSTGHVGIAIYDANVNKNGSSVIITH